MSWLSDRLYPGGVQSGTYAEITHTQGISFLIHAGVFVRLRIAASDVDASLLKGPRQREVTRTVARYVFDLHDATRLLSAVDGIVFQSRTGDEIRLWAVFERTDSAR